MNNMSYFWSSTEKETRVQLAALAGLTADGVKYHLNKLRAAGRLRHVGPTKGGHWEVLESEKARGAGA
ncbi:MAG: hypothetical protein HZT41_03865 [Dechloromonas sp.]|nr:MAG: hypothetical protein HZT41_03865 [Dechloromonas sp.]